MTLEYDLSIAGSALLAGILVLSTHIPLGQKVLERGIIFIDLAIAQVAGLGVVLTDTLSKEAQLAAVSASMLAGDTGSLNWCIFHPGCNRQYPIVIRQPSRRRTSAKSAGRSDFVGGLSTTVTGNGNLRVDTVYLVRLR